MVLSSKIYVRPLSWVHATGHKSWHKVFRVKLSLCARRLLGTRSVYLTTYTLWIVNAAIADALRTMYVSLYHHYHDQTVFPEFSSDCRAFGIAKFPKIMAWPFPSPVASNCRSIASIRCVVLTINSADL